jgi:hypothetical protein
MDSSTYVNPQYFLGFGTRMRPPTDVTSVHGTTQRR